MNELAETIIGKVAKHARHSANCNVLQSAKQIAYIFADFHFEAESEDYHRFCDAVAKVCPEEKALKERMADVNKRIFHRYTD